MNPWGGLGIIGAAGACGGLLNAFMAEGGLKLPRSQRAPDGTRIWLPGVTGNVIVGAAAGGVSWGLYGPVAAQLIVGATAQMASVSITFAALMGAVLVGIGGARWLSNEVDKKIQKATVNTFAGAPAAPANTLLAIKSAVRPLDALNIATQFSAPLKVGDGT